MKVATTGDKNIEIKVFFFHAAVTSKRDTHSFSNPRKETCLTNINISQVESHPRPLLFASHVLKHSHIFVN